jgi:hypothetical protein
MPPNFRPRQPAMKIPNLHSLPFKTQKGPGEMKSPRGLFFS